MIAAAPSPVEVPGVKTPNLHEHRESALSKFLGRQVDTTSDVATTNRAWALWKRIVDAHPREMPVPISDAGEEGEILLFWDTDAFYFSAEIPKSGNIYFFFRDNRSGKVWDREWPFSLVAPLPSDVIEKLSVIV